MAARKSKGLEGVGLPEGTEPPEMPGLPDGDLDPTGNFSEEILRLKARADEAKWTAELKRAEVEKLRAQSEADKIRETHAERTFTLYEGATKQALDVLREELRRAHGQNARLEQELVDARKEISDYLLHREEIAAARAQQELDAKTKDRAFSLLEPAVQRLTARALGGGQLEAEIAAFVKGIGDEQMVMLALFASDWPKEQRDRLAMLFELGGKKLPSPEQLKEAQEAEGTSNGG